jgi:CRISPR-associated endonuclease/helicase Cas3
LQRYTVQIPRRTFKALSEARAIQPVAPERWGRQFVVLTNQRLYRHDDDDVGLDWDQPEFLDAAGLVL